MRQSVMGPSKALSLALVGFVNVPGTHGQDIAPAAEEVSGESLSGAPWYSYERFQLTDNVIERISESHDYSDLWKFDDGDSRPLGRGDCRAFPGDESWPADDVWDTFNELLGGALIPTIPLAAPCYNSWGVYDEDKCSDTQESFSDPYLHENDPTSTMWPIYQGKTCLPTTNSSASCTLGGTPSYAVNVSTVAQVQLAVNLARNANLRLVIKNTGHCYLGKSNGAGALSVWTHNLKEILFIEEYETVGYKGPAMKVGAGATIEEVYLVAEENDVTASGGICGSVGYAGGYIAGGGHNPMSGYYGMAADHVMALEVVTASGHFVTATNTSRPDLFWALRGGGGSTFGVVTSVVIRVHPKIHATTSEFSIQTTDADVYFSALRLFFERFVEWTDAGTYSFFRAGVADGIYTLALVPFFAPNYTLTEFEDLMGPWFDQVRDLGIELEPTTKFHGSYYPAWEQTWGQSVSLNTVGGFMLPGNRLVPRSNFEDPDKFEKTFSVVRKHIEGSTRLIGYHQAPRNRANVDNAVSSGFRNVVAFLIAGIPVQSDTGPEEMGAAVTLLQEEVLAPWREVAPFSEGGGSYLNEASVMEPNWQAEFYGEQYPQLLRIKKDVDPLGVFYATTAVGSEEWEVRDGDQGVQTQNGRLCRL